MQVSYHIAQQIFGQHFSGRTKSPYLHPFYVLTDALREGALKPVFWVYQEKGDVFYYPFLLGQVNGTDFSDIQSAYAYGGPISSTFRQGFLAKAWQQYSLWCKQNRVLAEFTRFHPLMLNHLYFPGKTHYMRQTVWIDLYPGDPCSSFHPRAKTSVRKAYRHALRVEWVDPSCSHLYFYGLYTETMKRIQADPCYQFPLEYFARLAQWKHCHLAFCLQDNHVLAAAMFLKMGDLMEYHLAANTLKGNRLNANSLILDQAVRLAKKLGCTRLHLGGGTDNRIDNPLLFFKSAFSNRRADYHIAAVIHNPRSYNYLLKQFRYGENTNRVLFYRYPPNNGMEGV